MDPEPDILDIARKDFERATAFSLNVSGALNGQPSTDAIAFASLIQARMSVNAASADHLFTGFFADHSAVVAICRMIVEAMILYFYLAEHVSDEEWSCRKKILDLHDCVNRIKLMRAFRQQKDYATFMTRRATLQNELKENSFFAGLPIDQKTRLLSGEQIFVGGMLAAATRAAGWNERTFLAYYGYFSAQVHSSPMSFLRMKTHKVDFTAPSAHQVHLVSLALNVAEYCLLKVSMHYLGTSNHDVLGFEKNELDDLAAVLKRCAPSFETDIRQG